METSSADSFLRADQEEGREDVSVLEERLTEDMAVSADHLDGMEEVRRLWETSNMVSCVRADQAAGR